MRMSDAITAYILQMLEQTQNGSAELQRNTLAEQLGCVPSQINYVLQTRFTPANGYVVETRRGGGGYVRIQSVPLNSAHDFRPLMEASGKSLSEKQAEGILTYLVEEEIIPPDVGTLLKAILKERVLQPLQTMTTNEMRARLMVHLLAHMSIGSQEQSNSNDNAASTDDAAESDK